MAKGWNFVDLGEIEGWVGGANGLGESASGLELSSARHGKGPEGPIRQGNCILFGAHIDLKPGEKVEARLKVTFRKIAEAA